MNDFVPCTAKCNGKSNDELEAWSSLRSLFKACRYLKLLASQMPEMRIHSTPSLDAF